MSQTNGTSESGTKKNDQSHDLDQNENEDEESEGDGEDWTSFTILDKQGSFSAFMVWDHEKLPAADDPFVKGVSEWIRFAEAVRIRLYFCGFKIFPILLPWFSSGLHHRLSWIGD